MEIKLMKGKMLVAFLQYYKPYKKTAAFIIAGSFAVAFLDLIFPVFVRHILNVELPQRNLQSILLYALFLLIFVAAAAAGHRCRHFHKHIIFNNLHNS